MRDVNLKNGKWVYNCAKLWYTNEKFFDVWPFLWTKAAFG